MKFFIVIFCFLFLGVLWIIFDINQSQKYDEKLHIFAKTSIVYDLQKENNNFVYKENDDK